MIKAVKTGGGWGFLGVLVFTSHVKAIQCVSVKLKSIWYRWMLGEVCMDTKTVRETGSVSVHLSVCSPFYQASNFPTMQTNSILGFISSFVLKDRTILSQQVLSFSPLSTRKQFEGQIYDFIKIICLWFVVVFNTCVTARWPFGRGEPARHRL